MFVDNATGQAVFATDPRDFVAQDIAAQNVNASITPETQIDGDKSWRSLQDTVSFFDVFAMLARLLS